MEIVGTDRKQTLIAYGATVVAVLSGVLAVVTIFWHDWIEALTGWDPDHHSGSVELWVVIGLAIVSVVASVVARRSFRRIRPRPAIPGA